jgi:stage III sporulation protein SpoIIIAA
MSNVNSDLHDIMRLFPQLLKEQLEPHANEIEQITIQLEEKVCIITHNGDYELDFVATKAHYHDFILPKIGAFRDTGRIGIDGTMHRIARIPDVDGNAYGVIIRIARYLPGVAETIRDLLVPEKEEDKLASIVILGPPGRGKTTLLRDTGHILGDIYKTQCVTIDSGEIFGYGRKAHPCKGQGIRFMVADAFNQTNVLRQAIANSGAKVIVTDELRTPADAEAAIEAGFKGIRLVVTIHGDSLEDAMSNPSYEGLFGYFNNDRTRTLRKPAFQYAVEMVSRKEYIVHHNVRESVAAILAGRTPPTQVYSMKLNDAKSAVA